MCHRDLLVGVQVAWMATCLLWTGCGKNASSPSAVGMHDAEPAVPRVTIPRHNERRVDGLDSGRGDRNEVIQVHYDAPIEWRDSVGAGERVDRQQLQRAIELAGRYLTRACADDGRFVYRIYLDPAVEPAPSYNLLRHAGTIYALGKYTAWRSDRSVEEAALRAACFLKDQAVASVGGHRDQLAIWSPSEADSGAATLEAKLGGAGLGLVAFGSLEEFRPSSTPLEGLRGLGRFVLYMQRPDGSFFSKYVPSQGGRSDAWTSLYYPGEAALGLLTLYELDPQPQWRAGAERALNYLAQCRRNQKTVEADHWALLATAKLVQIAGREKWDIDRAALTYHAAQICQQMLNDMPPSRPLGAMAGCLTNDGRTCPTATRLEGMQAALPLLASDYSDLGDRMIPSIDAGIAFLVRAQVQSGLYAGGIPRSVVPVAWDKGRCDEVRIDYVQHALCAMLQYDSMRFGSN